MKKTLVLSIVFVISITSFASADTFASGTANEFNIDFVPISGSTNPGSGYGIVNKDYRMGTKEITNDQWNKFKAAYGDVVGSPSSAYDTDPQWGGTNIPTNNVSWYEAAQFVNWLNVSKNYQPAYMFSGEIHTSGYTLDVWGAGDADGTNLYRNKNAYYFLPTENEWVKAAYWNGTILQTYATKDGSTPAAGSCSNYNNAVGQPWAVGSGSEELNGTYDMMGNVYEWMESPWSTGDYLSGSNRAHRGGSYIYNYAGIGIASSGRDNNYPYAEYNDFGFRVASIVPEPCTLLLLGLGGLLIRKR